MGELVLLLLLVRARLVTTLEFVDLRGVPLKQHVQSAKGASSFSCSHAKATSGVRDARSEGLDS